MRTFFFDNGRKIDYDYLIKSKAKEKYDQVWVMAISCWRGKSDKRYFQQRKIISAISKTPMRDMPIPIPNWAGRPGDGPPEEKIIRCLLNLIHTKKKLTDWVNHCCRC